MVARESRAAAQTSAFRSHTPLGAAVSAIAEDPSLDISMPQRLTVWTVADRVPRRVAEHTVPSPEEGDSC